MNIEKENATFVIANYNFNSIRQFENEFQNSDSCKQFIDGFEKVPIKIKGEIPLPIDVEVPVTAFRKDFQQITYSLLEHRLDISTKDYSNDSVILKNMLLTLSQFKLQEINAIGINYNLECNTGEKRLNIFNLEIDKRIKDWSKNEGFSIIIPFSLSDYPCIATYSIEKVIGGIQEDGSFINYVYSIAVNYNFEMTEDKADIIKRLDKVKHIIEDIDTLYATFIEKCGEIIDL